MWKRSCRTTPYVGFDIPYELASYLTYIQDNRLVIHLKLPDYDPVLLRFKVEERALAALSR